MASTAEVDLVISTADTLPELERDLNAIIRTAENGAPELDIDAAIAVGESLSTIAEQLDGIVTSAEAGASDIELEAALDTQRSLAQIQGQIESIVQRSSQGEQIDIRAELDSVGSLSQVSGQLRALVAQAEAAAPEIEVEVEIDRDGEGRRSLTGLGRALATLVGPLTRTSAGILGAGVAASSAAPLLAGVATAVESIVPASAVAVTGLTALALAGGAIALAFQGVGDAITAAFDPEAKPEDLAKAMENLAPNARAFVTQLQAMKDEFRALREDVQQEFFAGFDQAMRNLGGTVLPQVSTALRTTATSLNRMALGAADAAVELAQDGVLGQALSGATKGLQNLEKVPGQVVTSLGLLGAAASPAFDRITQAASDAATRVSDRLSAAFESGALEEAINGAVDAIAQLGRIVGNVFSGLGNIIGTVTDQGEGLFFIMEKVTQAFEDVTASKGFQLALTALVEVASTLVSTVLPLISQALQALGPVFQALSAPVQILIRALGDGIGKILTALEPVLVSVANAFGQLVLVITPFINLAASLIAAILPALVPLFDGLGQTLNALIPFVEALVTNIANQLLPVFTKLATEVLPQLIPPFVELSTRLIPVLTEVIIGLAPTLAKLGELFANLLVALTPVIVEVLNLGVALLDKLLPVIQPVLDLIIKLIEIGLKILAAQITGLVIPAINILVSLLRGDFSAAWEGAKNLVNNIANKIAEIVGRMKDLAVARIKELGSEAVRGFQDLVDRSVAKVRELPGQIRAALGNLGSLLVSAGSDLVQGLINGITGKLGALRDAASKIADAVSGTVGALLDINSPSRVMRDQGHDTMDGYVLGIKDRIPDLRSQLQGVAALAPSFALPGGQTLQLPQFNQTAPTVQVFIGNEQLNAHFDTRIAQSNVARDRLAITGVRR